MSLIFNLLSKEQGLFFWSVVKLPVLEDGASRSSVLTAFLTRKVCFPVFVIVLTMTVIFISTIPEYTENVLEAVMSGLLFLMSLAILGGWLFWGLIGGGIVTIILLTVCLIIATVAKSPVYMREVFLFAGIGFFCYVLLEREEITKRRVELRLQGINESKNTVELSYSKHRLTGEALRGRINSYLMLEEIARVLTSGLDFEKTATLIVKKTLEVVGKEGLCVLYLADVEGQKLALKASWKSRIRAKTGDDFDDWVLKQGQVLLVENVDNDFRFTGGGVGRERRIGSLISAPLISGERIIGVLRVDSKEANIFVTDDLRVLNVLAVLSAVAIENARLYRRTEELAITDGLTGLYVHRYFQERLTEELMRATRSRSLLSFLMIDIDHFKNYNDRYGHAVGDIVLKKVAVILKEKAGDGSSVARYGGEEFAVVLPRVGKEDAIKVAEVICKAVASEEISVRDEKTNITVSAGVSTFPSDAIMKEEVIRKADEALLRAKAEGRNKVCAA